MKISKILFLLISIVLVISSCSPGKRVARILRNHPEMVKTDTVWKKDTIVVAGAAKDSTFHFFQHDTITLKKDQMTLKYYFNSDSTVYLQGKCDPIVKSYFYPVVRTVASIPAKLTFNERVVLWVSRNWWWLLIIFFLFKFLWKTFGTVIKLYVPWLNFLK